MAYCIGGAWVIPGGLGPGEFFLRGRVHRDPYATIRWSRDQAGCPSHLQAIEWGIAIRNAVNVALYAEEAPTVIYPTVDWPIEAERRVVYWNGGASDRP